MNHASEVVELGTICLSQHSNPGRVPVRILREASQLQAVRLTNGHPDKQAQVLSERFTKSLALTKASGGCDSSDCLLCQYSQSCDDHPDRIWKERKRSPLAAGLYMPGSEEGVSSLQHAAVRPRKTHVVSSSTGRSQNRDSSNPSPGTSSSTDVAASYICEPVSTPWQWCPEYVLLEDPVPAQLVDLACLHSNHGRQRTNYSDIICALEFSTDGSLIAAGGVAKEIRLYALPDLGSSAQGAWEEEEDTASCLPGGKPTCRKQPNLPLASHPMPGKISCLAWDPCSEGLVTVGDYDGVLHQVHLASGHRGVEVEAHSGRRIWSVAHSNLRPHVCVSTSDDRTARLWHGSGLTHEALVIRPCVQGGTPTSICCAEFSPFDENLLALSSSDHCVYLYDLRSAAQPLEVLRYHTRPVSYVSFMGPGRLVSASTDSTLAIWELGGSSSRGNSSGATGAESVDAATEQQQQQLGRQPWKVMRGHRNEKNFVGLSVRPEGRAPGHGLIACGSETANVYAYHTSWTGPLAAAAILGQPGSAGPTAGKQQQQMAGLSEVGPAEAPRRPGAAGSGDSGFVSAVCWQPAAAPAALGLPPILAAGTSCGDIRLLALTEG